MRRTITRSIILTISVLFIISMGLAFFLRSKQAKYQGEIKITELQEKTDVYFDEWAIPHIQAKNEHDAYVALGYVHAQERLFQMEMMRRLAKGELSEILGPELIKYDKMFRTVGIHRIAKKLAENLDSQSASTKAFQAYLDGVNAFIRTGPKPIEFHILGIEAKPFEMMDPFAIAGYMSFSFFKGIQTDPLLNYLDHTLAPEFKHDIAPFKKHVIASLNSHELSSLEDITAFAMNLMEQPFSFFEGSNAWVISGQKTESGKPILANDPHIGYSSPSVWFEAVLDYPGFKLYGHYLAGVPVALLGHNEDHAWGLTMLQNKDSDFYKEKMNPENEHQYWFRDHWEMINSDVEVLNVKGGSEEIFNVKTTRHGPIINEFIDGFEKLGYPIAMKWGFNDTENKVVEAFYSLARAKTISEAQNAVSQIYSPGLNVVYANQTDIAWWAAAKFPIRSADSEGRFVLDGSTGEDEYKGYYPFSSHPMKINPAEGFIVSANQDPFIHHPYEVAGYYNPIYRYNKIVEILNSKGSRITIEDSKSLQLHTKNDTYARIIKEIAPILDHKDILNTELKEAAFTLVKTWDLDHTIESQGATVFHEFLGRLVEKIFEARLTKTFYDCFRGSNLIHDSILSVMENENSPWWIVDGVNKRKEWIQETFLSSVEALEKTLGPKPLQWNWGRVHTVKQRHFLGSSPIGWMFNVGPYAASGSSEVIHNSNFKFGPGLHTSDYGPSTRRVIDMMHPEDSWGINPTGQSGYFMNPHYHDQTAMYHQGQYRKQILNASSIKDSQHLKLTPN